MTRKTIDLISSWTLYPLADLLVQLSMHEFNAMRLVTIALAGGLVYRREIPTWFSQLDLAKLSGVGRTIGSLIYFNPLWIARHMLFIKIATSSWAEITSGALVLIALLLGIKSFLLNLPLSLAGNYIIQTKLPVDVRYLGSIVLSGLLAVIYALMASFCK